MGLCRKGRQQGSRRRDLTFVATWAGVAYVCLIIAFSRMIVGWRCASHVRTETSSTPSRWPAGAAAPATVDDGPI